MRIYQSDDGQWILLTEVSKFYFDTEGEALYMEKKLQFINAVREWISDYKHLMQRAWQLKNNYGLYSTILTEEDIPEDVIPNTDRLTSFVNAFANLETIFTSFDAGIDDNFERVV